MLLSSGLPVEIGSDEIVARHIFDRSHILEASVLDGPFRPAAQAFYPVPGHTVFSVSRLLGLTTDEAVQENGVEVGAMPRANGKAGRVLKGYSTLQAGSLRSVTVIDRGKELWKLNVVSDEPLPPAHPTPFHAHVSGFLPLPEGAKHKEFYKNICEDIRAIAEDVRLRSIPFKPWENNGSPRAPEIAA